MIYMQFFMCTVSVLYLPFTLKIITLLPKHIEMYILFKVGGGVSVFLDFCVKSDDDFVKLCLQ